MTEVKEVDQVITQREIRQRLHVTMLEILDESEQHRHKCQADPYDASLHDIGDDESVTRTRFVVKHLRIGRQRSQGQGSKGIHDQIDPKHLGYRKRRSGAQHGAQQDDKACRHVDGHLEQDETLYVDIKRPAPCDRLCDALERVVEDRDVAGFFGHRGAVAHRKANMGGI